jgi:hypothetical protein
MGVHKKCQGLIDIDIDFKCDPCLYISKLGKTLSSDKLCCNICLKPGGALKIVEKNEKKKAREFYHIFCSMIIGRYQDVRNMKKFVIKDEFLPTGTCTSCHKNGGNLLLNGMHPMCAWLSGVVFKLDYC